VAGGIGRLAVTILAYADRDSSRAGESIAFHVSTDSAQYAAQVVRLHCSEVGPDGPPFREEEVPTGIEGIFPGSIQELRPGSFLYLPEPIELGPQVSFRLGVFPTRPRISRQTILWIAGASASIELYLDERSRLCLGVGDRTVVACPLPLPRRQWSGVVATVSLADGTARLTAMTRGRTGLLAEHSCSAEGSFPAGTGLGPAVVAVAARLEGAHPPVAQAGTQFDGKVERVTFFSSPLDGPETERVCRGLPDEGVGETILDWDLSQGISTETVTDASGGGHGGVLVNLPSRAVKGSNWSGRYLEWREHPEEYGAIHFHADDIADAGWSVNHLLEIPVDTPSGCYALRLRDSDSEWHVPFMVRPGAGQKRSEVAYLIPTLTYGAYANMNLRIRAAFNEINQGRLTTLDRTDLLLLEYPSLGLSTYDVHPDGSPVHYSSMRRPVTNFRPKGRIYKFCQDLLIVDWLEHQGCEFDVLTDEDLHREGQAAIAGYRVVIVASHPEYYSARMLDALEMYAGGGGRLMILGGNVFWWGAEFHPERPGTVEVRRPSTGSLWTVDMSEGCFSFTGEPGGTWRNIGRPPEKLSGSGYMTIGFDEYRPYRRTELSSSEQGRAAFVFSGVEDTVIGDFGFLQGGASGMEIDRANVDAGTPPQAIVLASSWGHSNNFTNVPEAWMDTLPPGKEGDPDPIRSDMVFFEAPNGGAVFSVGSIAWSGSLSWNNYDNNVSRITLNVLNRFRDAAAFELP
jgi:N,N-dimethylformamidase